MRWADCLLCDASSSLDVSRWQQKKQQKQINCFSQAYQFFLIALHWQGRTRTPSMIRRRTEIDRLNANMGIKISSTNAYERNYKKHLWMFMFLHTLSMAIIWLCISWTRNKSCQRMRHLICCFLVWLHIEAYTRNMFPCLSFAFTWFPFDLNGSYLPIQHLQLHTLRNAYARLRWCVELWSRPLLVARNNGHAKSFNTHRNGSLWIRSHACSDIDGEGEHLSGALVRC